MEIKKRQIEEIFFVAFDGKEFKTQDECIHYECVQKGKRKNCDECHSKGEITCNNDMDGAGNWGSATGVLYWQERCKKCNGKGYLELSEVWS